MARDSAQFSVRSLLVIVTIVGFLLGMYTTIWEEHPLIPFVATTMMSAGFGIKLQRNGNRRSLMGAIIGGAVGANCAVALHLFCGYTMLESFEDEGLGFLGSVSVLAPYATICGIVIGGLVWAGALLVSWIVRRHLAHDQRT